MTDSPSAFEALNAGYMRFREKLWHPQHERWMRLKDGQSPKVMVISCSDSRVDPAQVFDVDPGEIFVVRNVAAMVPPFETTPGHHGVSAALEFAVQVLEVEEIVVLGHGMCGGCQAALSQKMLGAEPGKGGFIADWIDLLDDARESVQSLRLRSMPLICDGADVEHAKPAPDLLIKAASLLDVRPAETWYVGDSRWDMVASKAAGMRAIAVLTGATTEEALSEAGADVIYPTLAELMADLPAD